MPISWFTYRSSHLGVAEWRQHGRLHAHLPLALAASRQSPSGCSTQHNADTSIRLNQSVSSPLYTAVVRMQPKSHTHWLTPYQLIHGPTKQLACSLTDY